MHISSKQSRSGIPNTEIFQRLAKLPSYVYDETYPSTFAHPTQRTELQFDMPPPAYPRNLDEWNTNPRPLPILHILAPKELHQQSFFSLNPAIEKHPQHKRIPPETVEIAQHHLCTESPPEKSKIRGMP